MANKPFFSDTAKMAEQMEPVVVEDDEEEDRGEEEDHGDEVVQQRLNLQDNRQMPASSSMKTMLFQLGPPVNWAA